MKKSASLINKFQGMGHGQYTEITESEFLGSVLKSPRVVVHFYHQEFARCKAVDAKMIQIAPVIMGCRLLKIDATKCPFFISKLEIKILPTIVYFINGKTVHRITGFSEFGGNEDFKVSELLKSLQKHKMLRDSDENSWRPLMMTSTTTVKHPGREAISDDDLSDAY
jgi:thioredoxin-like negative regulator of GroEL